MRATIATNLARLLCADIDELQMSQTIEVAIAAATEYGYKDDVRGILQSAFLQLAEAAEASPDPTSARIVPAVKALEAALASHRHSQPA